MVWENGRWLRSVLDFIREWIRKPVVGFLDLPFTGLSVRRCFELPIGFEEHPLALGFELVTCSLQGVEPVECWPKLALYPP